MMRQGVISAVIYLLLAMLVMIYMPEGYVKERIDGHQAY